MTKRTVTCEITDLELMRMLPPVPLPVQIRQKLNSHGFKFTDDGKLSAVVNESPTPIGTIETRSDLVNNSVFYKQVIDVDSPVLASSYDEGQS